MNMDTNYFTAGTIMLLAVAVAIIFWHAANKRERETESQQQTTYWSGASPLYTDGTESESFSSRITYAPRIEIGFREDGVVVWRELGGGESENQQGETNVPK